MKKSQTTAIAFAILILPSQLIYAGSATWKLDPVTDIWTNSRNWTPATVPNGPEDVATFAASNHPAVTFEDLVPVELSGIVFSPGASAFTITEAFGESLTISGMGVTNDSGITQNIVLGQNGKVTFSNNATAGTDIIYTNNASTYPGFLLFYDTSSAGDATIINNPGLHPNAGFTLFFDSSSAGNAVIINVSETGKDSGGTQFAGSSTAGAATIVNKGSGRFAVTSFSEFSTAGTATIINEGSQIAGGSAGLTTFLGGDDLVSAGNSTIINYGGAVEGASVARTNFGYGSTAGNSTLIGYGGRFAGGYISFEYDSDGGTARIEVFDNAIMTLNYHIGDMTVGSIEGDGKVDLTGGNLSVGSNNLNTVFQGRIVGDGKLIKIGDGRLVLSGRNFYHGGTQIMRGEVVVNNRQGSGTGSGPVAVVSGTLSGRGIISDSVTVDGDGPGNAILSPGKNAARPQTLTVQGELIFTDQGRYRCGLDSQTALADEVVAGGVTVEGAIFELADSNTAVIPPGATFTVIDNTSATAISGTFTNLPDGGTITAGSNTFQANYEGGDGNDLTLTVVP